MCKENNITKATVLGASLAKDNNRERLCLCDEENGYMENIIENHCNGEFHEKAHDTKFFNKKKYFHSCGEEFHCQRIWLHSGRGFLLCHHTEILDLLKLTCRASVAGAWKTRRR